MMARQTSILKFFNKSPKASPLVSTEVKNNKNDLKQIDDTKENSKPIKHKFDLYEIVWARLDGYPHWPAIICNHPGLKTYFKTVKSYEYLNVQFFDNPPQRAWIKVEDCVLLENDKHPTMKKISDNSLQNSIQWSLEVLKKNKQERSKIIIKFPLSDEEEEEDDCNSSISEQLSPLNKSTRIKAKRKLESESDEEISLSNKKKILIDSEDSEDDYQPNKSLSSSSESESENISDVSSESEPEDDEVVDSPKFKKTANKSTKVNLNKTSDKLNSQNEEGKPVEMKEWRHLSFDFLKPDKIKDKEGRSPDHPDYDPSTLYVPPNFIKNETPAHQQWWKIKTDNFDVVLFFKMGKFYELFHMDAVILCNEANLIYMKGEYAHSGFPEIAFQRFANLLIQKGYKVARIEQTETPEQRDERCKNNSKQSKVVKREVCRVTSLGTKSLLEFSDVAKKTHLSFLYSITEKELPDNQVLTGLSFVDATVGEFYLIQFIDDKYLSTLRTIISHYPPIEILLEKDNVTNNTLQTIKAVVPNVATTTLRSDKEFWKPREVLKFLIEGPYFKIMKEDTEKFEIPVEFKKILDDSDVLNLTVKKDYELCLKALGAIVFQLKRHLIEEDLLSLGKFKILDSDFFTTNNNDESNADFMVLDSVTIKNLELFENCIGTTEATLIEAIDFCVTKFGKRLLRNWICSPLCRKEEIENRLDAVTELIELNLLDLHKGLENLPDLERILCKIHAQSLAHRSKNHPDSRAVLFEANTYNKSKINEFCSLLESFKACDKFIKEIKKLCPEPSSKFLSYLISYKEDGGYFPNSNFILSYFDNAFDHKVAKEKGIIIPKKGVNKLYEKANENIASVIKDLDNYLKEVSIKVGTKIKYFGKGKNRYQLEVPENAAKKIDKEFELTSSRKGFKRYQSEKIRNLLNDLKKYEEDKEEAMQESLRLIFESFIGHSEEWRKIIEIVAILDCLISFSIYSKSLKSKGIYSKPKILDYKGESLIKVKNGLHPVLMNVVDNFMPNDIELDQKLMLLTGPNMGGKSTLMRQTGLLVLLAHIGCHVPAESLECTLIDRIFTRLGATDRILEGESTFYVELSETSTIIRNATSKSLVLLDELGRGTSTYDGTSIACSVVNYLCNNIKCLTMFSTHYSSLLEEFKVEDNIIFAHMACVVENEDFQDPTNECITFLYKLIPGPCPKSYGFNAAKLSDIPDHVIKCGFEKAKKLESKVESVKLLTKLLNKTINSKEAKLLINYLKNYN